MKALVNAVASSIEAEVSEAAEWTIEKYDPLWRNPKKGKVLNVYPGRTIPTQARWTGSVIDQVEIVCEYMEPSGTKPLTRDEDAELAAEDVADSLRDWGLAHEAGFAPAHKMDWAETLYAPSVSRESFVRYCRVIFVFEVVKEFG